MVGGTVVVEEAVSPLEGAGYTEEEGLGAQQSMTNQCQSSQVQSLLLDRLMLGASKSIIGVIHGGM